MRITTVALLCVAAAAPLTAQERDLHIEVTVPVSIEDAFRMWIDSAEAREFLALEVRIDPWVGGRYEANFDPESDPWGALAGTYGSKVLALEPPRRLVFEWHYLTPREAATQVGGRRVRQETTVEVTFEPLGKHETRIRIRHYGFGSDANWAASRRFYEQSGWPWIIKRLRGRFTKGKENGRDGHAAISSEQET